jgi:hypothetical protein
MKPLVLLGMVVCVLAAAALAYQGFTFTTREEVLDIGPLRATTEQKHSVPLPPIAGALGLAAGIALVVVGMRRQ